MSKRKSFTVLLASGALLCTLAACSGDGAELLGPFDPPQETISEPCGAFEPEHFGSVEIAELLEDERGTYCSVKLGPRNAENYVTLENYPEFAQAGFTAEEVAAAQEVTYDFLATKTLDSPFLDSFEQGAYEEWVRSLELLPEELRDEALGAPASLIVHDILPELTAREGLPRGEYYFLSPAQLGTYEAPGDGSKHLTVSVHYEVDYLLEEGVQRVEGNFTMNFAMGQPGRVTGVNNDYRLTE